MQWWRVIVSRGHHALLLIHFLSERIMRFNVLLRAALCSSLLLSIMPSIAVAEPFAIKVDGLNRGSLHIISAAPLTYWRESCRVRFSA